MRIVLNDMLNAKGVSEPLREAVKVLQRENAELREALQHPSYEEENRLRAEVAKLRAAMKQHEPVAWVVPPSRHPHWGGYAMQYSAWEVRQCGGTAKAAPLYGLHGAQPAPSVPTGWKLVPVEPTPAMITAALEASDMLNVRRVLACYDAMLAAAPEAKS